MFIGYACMGATTLDARLGYNKESPAISNAWRPQSQSAPAHAAAPFVLTTTAMALRGAQASTQDMPTKASSISTPHSSRISTFRWAPWDACLTASASKMDIGWHKLHLHGSSKTSCRKLAIWARAGAKGLNSLTPVI